MIIGLSGKKQSGKNTAARHIGLEWGLDKGFVTQEFSYADVLKRTCMQLFGLTYEQCYGTDEQKNSLTNIRWNDMPVPIPRDIFCEAQQYDVWMTGREVLQYFGTNIVRKMFPDAWVQATLSEIESCRPNIALVTDVRFPNEVLGIQRVGGKVLRLTRNPHPGDSHESETALDNYTGFDYVLDNSSMNIEQQRQAVLPIVSTWLFGPNDQ